MCDMKIGSVAIVAADPLIASRGVMLHGLLPLLKLVFFWFLLPQLQGCAAVAEFALAKWEFDWP